METQGYPYEFLVSSDDDVYARLHIQQYLSNSLDGPEYMELSGGSHHHAHSSNSALREAEAQARAQMQAEEAQAEEKKRESHQHQHQLARQQVQAPPHPRQQKDHFPLANMRVHVPPFVPPPVQFFNPPPQSQQQPQPQQQPMFSDHMPPQYRFESIPIPSLAIRNGSMMSSTPAAPPSSPVAYPASQAFSQLKPHPPYSRGGAPPTHSASSSSSSSPASSPRSAPTSPRPMATMVPSLGSEPKEMQLTLFHKPRHFGGKWFPIEPHGRLRVTKGVGKKIRLQINCNFPFDWNEISFHLLDVPISKTFPESEQNFMIDMDKSMKTKDGCGVVEVKLKRLSKELKFGVTLTSKYGWKCEGYTVPIVTHNNGKDKANRSSMKT
ncbi:hypothetical protein QOT17_024579 [Balamuthia mandrillaris]